MKYPKGAIKTIAEFEDHIKAGVEAVYFASKHEIVKESIENISGARITADPENDRYFELEFRGGGAWTSPISGFYFPESSGETWFVFTNYWLAFGYYQRIIGKQKKKLHS